MFFLHVPFDIMLWCNYKEKIPLFYVEHNLQTKIDHKTNQKKINLVGGHVTC